MKSGKVWGKTECLISTPFVAVHKLVIEQTGTCSAHRHRLKANFFYVISGRLRVWVEKSDYDLTDMTELREGECMEVVPGEYHWFEAMTLCQALEIYYPLPLGEDIERRNCGMIRGAPAGST